MHGFDYSDNSSNGEPEKHQVCPDHSIDIYSVRKTQLVSKLCSKPVNPDSEISNCAVVLCAVTCSERSFESPIIVKQRRWTKRPVFCGSNGKWHGKEDIELFRSDENACRVQNTIRAYVNTPATAKLDISVTYRQVHLVGFVVGSQKKLKINWIR